jgi:hypothetical protein
MDWDNFTPSADWIAGQFTEAFGWEERPRYNIRAMGIRDRPAAPRSLSQNEQSEWLIDMILERSLQPT